VRKDEIDRAIILIYRSRNAHGFVNFSQPITALDNLPMEGLEELVSVYQNRVAEVEKEIEWRKVEDMPVYSRKHYEDERK